jgi:two-component system CheB/CheR fusion protein
VAFEDWPEPQLSPAEPKEELEEEEERPEDVKLAQLNKELRDTRAELQHMIEEKQASQEELMSMNEELQSANEELQSTNEELTSSKEELQSINEEIQTMNAELQSKIDALTQSHDDMRNLLQSSDIPMAFLDSDLKVRRFTDAIKPIINLRGNDIGRPISDLKLNLLNVDFVHDAQEVLETLQLKEKRVQTEDERWFQMRLMPYRTSDNKINGVTVTFMDITEIEETEQFLRNLVESIIAASREPLLVLDSEMRVVLANQSFFRTFDVSAKETTCKLLYTLGNKQWDIPRLRQLLEDILPRKSSIEDFEVKQNFPKIGERTMLLNAHKIQSDLGPGLILLAIEDITDRQAGTTSESQDARKDAAS